MATLPTTHPNITEVIADIPLLRHRDTVSTPADQDDFVAKYEATNDHLSNNTVPEINTQKDEQNTLADWMETTATEVYNNAGEAASSASTALAASNNKGNWSALTGALNIPASVNHNGSIWVLNVNLADVTLSEPTAINTDWTSTGVSSADLDLKADKADPIFTGLITEEVSVSTLTLGATSSVQTYTAIGDFIIIDDLVDGEFVTMFAQSAGFTPTYPTITWLDSADGTTEPPIATITKVLYEKVNGVLYGTVQGYVL